MNTMFKLLIICAVTLAGCIFHPSGVTDSSVDLEKRIVGGEAFEGLQAVGALTYNGNAHCTGTLVGEKTVVTAAHCLVGVTASKMRFVIGSDIVKPQYSLRVESTKYHPKYDDRNIVNDIGFVTLTQEAPIEHMVLLDKMDESFVGQNLFFVGYGVDNAYTNSGAGKKRAVWMTVSSVSNTTFRYDDAGRNTCYGDSGGPAFVRDSAGNYLVAGVTSYGDYYCTSYGVDTKVSAYLDFLGISGIAPLGQITVEPVTSDVEECDGETFMGRCDSNDVVWCEGGLVYRLDCLEKELVCVFDDLRQYYGCGSLVQAEECMGENYAGRCQDHTLIWCENGNVFAVDCAESSTECRWDWSNGYFNCQQ